MEKGNCYDFTIVELLGAYLKGGIGVAGKALAK